MRSIGFDFGSVYTKAIVRSEDGSIDLALWRRKIAGGTAALESLIDDLASHFPDERFRLGVAAGSATSAARGMVLSNPLLAIAAGVRELHPSARNVIEIGGHTSKLVVLNEDGSIADFSTNEACAAGTGSFLEQQAKRMALTIEQLAALSSKAKAGATIAGRCSVFAKSDMIHLQQKGTPVEEIALGLCLAICRNAAGTLLKGRELAGPVLIAGGCAQNGGVVRGFRETISPDVLVSARPGLEAALGAAARAAASTTEGLSLAEIRAALSSFVARASCGAAMLPALRRPTAASRRTEPAGVHSSPADAYLGVDVGSVSTDLVLLDRDGELISAVYLSTRGRPVDVLLEGLGILRERFPAGLRIIGCGATGSGRHLAARILGADAVRNEITAQMLGAERHVPDVDTIFEIGGQDSKFISLRHGAIADFAMNKICAAGTGSFLEEQAREMSVEIVRDFAPEALSSASPLDLGSRCTVFMETEVVNALQGGEDVGDICAGLAHSIVNNYLEKVVGPRPIGEIIVFQGGVASNDAVVAAFESVIGKPIHVHPYNRLSGAIGAGLAAMEATAGGKPSKFRAIDTAARPSVRSFECPHCSNRCEVNVVSVEGKHAFFGDTCERYTSRAADAAIALPPNLADEYIARCEEAFARAEGGLKIGIPRASTFFNSLAFWGTFFKALGHTPVLSPPSSEKTVALGLKHLAAGVCLPIKLAAGHVDALMAEDVDLVFLPSIVRISGDDASPAYACPYAMAAPFIVSTRASARLLAPVVSLHDEEAFLDDFEPYVESLRTTREAMSEAWREGVRAQQELDAEFRRRASFLIRSGPQRYTFAILGKPYNTLDGYLNLSLFERLRRLNVLAVPQSFLPVDRGGTASDLPWHFSANIDVAAQAVARTTGLHPVIVSNFGCGPDAFTFKRIEPLLAERPHLILEFDEHRGEAGLVTRIEAFLDQLDGSRRATSVAAVAAESAQTEIPPPGSTVYIPYFADHAHAFAGLLRLRGCNTQILPPPTAHIHALGAKHSIGKECHAYSVMAGDLIDLSARHEGERVCFFFPGTSLPCLLHEYGRGMRVLLEQLGIEHVMVCSPKGSDVYDAFPIETLERFYLALLSIDLLVKAVYQTRPYECEKGTTDAVHQENLLAIEEAVVRGNVLEALDVALGRVAAIEVERIAPRPVVGMAGDIYTKSNAAANQDLVRWLEEQGLEVWPSPFQTDLLDFGISRNLSRSIERLDVGGLLLHGSLAADRAIQQWRVHRVVGNRVIRQDEPGYLEMRKFTAPYMPNESHELLFISVAKIVDFCRRGADGIINAICFNCMVGNAAAAINEKIRRDFDGLPIITAIYSDGEDPARRMMLQAFVSQVFAHHERAERTKSNLPGSLLDRLLSRLPAVEDRKR